MYDYINGKLTYKSISTKGCTITVETSGIGYLLEIMERDYNILPEIDEPIKAFTVLIHKEDKMSLCGFLKREDRDIFNVLTSVSGVGTKMALTLINSFDTPNLIGLVLDGNYKELTNAKGVGPKLAQKIILELKDKLNSYKNVDIPQSKSVDKINSQNVEDAKMVLASLGYEAKEINNAITSAISKVAENSSAEVILKETLKILSL